MRTEKAKAWEREYRKRPEVRKKYRAYERKRRKKPEVRERTRVYMREYMRKVFALARAAREAGLEA